MSTHVENSDRQRMQNYMENLFAVLDGTAKDGCKNSVRIVREESGPFCVITLECGHEYDVPLFKGRGHKGIVTAEDLIGWVQHIGEKQWACKETLLRFIGSVVSEKGWSKTGVIST